MITFISCSDCELSTIYRSRNRCLDWYWCVSLSLNKFPIFCIQTEKVKLMKRQQDLWHHHPHGSQTKQSYSTTCVWFSFRPFLPTFTLLSLFFFPFLKGKWEEEAGGGGTLSHPVSELSTTAPLVGDWSWYLSSSLPRTTLSFCSSLITICSAAFPLGKPGKRNLLGG